MRLQHGPIDVVVRAWGEPSEVELAHQQLENRFDTILAELVAELPRLREPLGETYPLFSGRTARRMAAAVWPHRGVFITPMAAVAGAVAEELLDALLAGRKLEKAFVNDGGDIAVHLSPGASLRAGIVNDLLHPGIDATTEISFASPVRGIATSGWRGRSQSLGIADAVTVLAPTASQADAAATLIANAVNVDHPAIERRPARSLKEDSDLGDLTVTVHVPALPEKEVLKALTNGLAVAQRMQRVGLVTAAYLALQGQVLTLPECVASRSASR
ncbi:MAG TPA: UPF0280 family protein [Burkholderiales bacterium]|nr:UPF0280 family protein [Burkholderiales bacterium]